MILSLRAIMAGTSTETWLTLMPCAASLDLA